MVYGRTLKPTVRLSAQLHRRYPTLDSWCPSVMAVAMMWAQFAATNATLDIMSLTVLIRKSESEYTFQVHYSIEFVTAFIGLKTMTTHAQRSQHSFLDILFIQLKFILPFLLKII